MSVFDTLFEPVAEGLFDVFGESSGVVKLTASVAESTIAKAIIDETGLNAVDVVDEAGQRVTAHALLMVPHGTALDVIGDRIRRGSDVFKVVGRVSDSGNLTTYVLSKTGHAVIRHVRLHSRQN